MLDFTPGANVIVQVIPPKNMVVEFWRSSEDEGATLVAIKAQHHRNGIVVHNYGAHEEGVEYWTCLSPERQTAMRVRPE